MTVERRERGEAGIIKSKRHADAENGPRHSEHDCAVRRCKHNKAAGQYHIRKHQHAASAATVDDTPNGRAGECGNQQGAGKGAEHPRSRHADAGADRFGENCRQIVARRPSERLRDPERGDNKAARADGPGLLVSVSQTDSSIRLQSSGGQTESRAATRGV